MTLTSIKLLINIFFNVQSIENKNLKGNIPNVLFSKMQTFRVANYLFRTLYIIETHFLCYLM